MPTFPRIAWHELGRLSVDGPTTFGDVDGVDRVFFLGILLQTRGPAATQKFSFTFCHVRRQTVEVDWTGFNTAMKAALKRVNRSK